MPVLLMRHAETDWALVNARQLRGAANDLAPLTPAGRVQAEHAAVACPRPELVVASPMTRALQTASIIASTVGAPLSVEFDLREWVPDQTYSWTTSAEVLAAYEDMITHRGVRPSGEPRTWEPLRAVRARAARALRPYVNLDGVVLAVCHAVVIFALTGNEDSGHCVTWPYEPGDLVRHRAKVPSR